MKPPAILLRRLLVTCKRRRSPSSALCLSSSHEKVKEKPAKEKSVKEKYRKPPGASSFEPPSTDYASMRASVGIVTVARVSGTPILPCSFSSRHRVVLNSWDRFVIPLPFTRGVIIWGEPITVARDAGPDVIEAARLQIEASLTAVTDAADGAMGVEAVAPAPAGAAA